MIINKLTKDRRRAIKHEKRLQWQKFFALWPRRIDDNRMVWLSYLYRRLEKDEYSSSYIWRYKLTNELVLEKLKDDVKEEKPKGETSQERLAKWIMAYQSQKLP